MSQTFFTSDTHFGHARICELSHRPFGSIEEHDEALIANWNAAVGEDDIVWHLGDYALGDRRQALGYLDRLSGRKRLIAGNHDKCHAGSINGWKRVAEYMSAGFEVVLPWAKVKLPPLGPDQPGLKVLLSHFPYDGDHVGEERHTQSRLRDLGTPLVHGHVHEAWGVRRSRATCAVQVNVGVDRRDYRPVSEKEVHALVRSMDTE